MRLRGPKAYTDIEEHKEKGRSPGNPEMLRPLRSSRYLPTTSLSGDAFLNHDYSCCVGLTLSIRLGLANRHWISRNDGVAGAGGHWMRAVVYREGKEASGRKRCA